MRALAAILLIACSKPAAPPPPAGSPEALAAYLKTASAKDVTGWILEPPAWDRIIISPYRELWPEYQKRFDSASDALLAQVGHAGATRRHYAGDPRLSRSQTRLRWALPPQYPSVVADGIDTVFVWDGTGWRVLAGLDDVLHDHVMALDPHCAELLLRAGGTNQRCNEVGWYVADTALRTKMESGGLGPTDGADTKGFLHACEMAEPACGNEAP